MSDGEREGIGRAVGLPLFALLEEIDLYQAFADLMKVFLFGFQAAYPLYSASFLFGNGSHVAASGHKGEAVGGADSSGEGEGVGGGRRKADCDDGWYFGALQIVEFVHHVGVYLCLSTQGGNQFDEERFGLSGILFLSEYLLVGIDFERGGTKDGVVGLGVFVIKGRRVSMANLGFDVGGNVENSVLLLVDDETRLLLVYRHGLQALLRLGIDAIAAFEQMEIIVLVDCEGPLGDSRH